jgi:hypothetical protein
MRLAPADDRFRREVCLRRVVPGDGSEVIALASLLRPGGARSRRTSVFPCKKPRVLLGALQRAVVQDQVNAYDAATVAMFGGRSACIGGLASSCSTRRSERSA